jgi:hypothetical protein
MREFGSSSSAEHSVVANSNTSEHWGFFDGGPFNLSLELLCESLALKTMGRITANMQSSSTATESGIHVSTAAKMTPESAIMLSSLAFVGSDTKVLRESKTLLFENEGAMSIVVN